MKENKFLKMKIKKYEKQIKNITSQFELKIKELLSEIKMYKEFQETYIIKNYERVKRNIENNIENEIEKKNNIKKDIIQKNEIKENINTEEEKNKKIIYQLIKNISPLDEQKDKLEFKIPLKDFDVYKISTTPCLI